MSSLANEVLEDVLKPLDRCSLDGVQFTNRRFLQLILERMADVCLRDIDSATFEVKGDETNYFILMDGRPVKGTPYNTRPERWISKVHRDTAHLFSEFVQALWSSRIVGLTFFRLVFAPEFAALMIQTPIVADSLCLGTETSCAELTPTQFREFVLHFSPSSLYFTYSHLRPGQITNGFLGTLSLRAQSKNRMLCARLPRKVPVDGGSFCATDDAVVDFCMQPDILVAQEEDAPKKKKKPYAELALYHGRFTKDLFKRLVEASAVSKRTQPLRIFVSPVRIEDGDLRDFADHLWHSRHHGTVYHLRVYDFLGEPQGADAAVCLQIALHSENDGLEVIRAPIPNDLFYDQDE
ncbi:hypothetical protein AAVH_17919 [Aphelenchoides avenae]|nr:hypothetical protein AAVH_17919 [Aphelenchus avenae]